MAGLGVRPKKRTIVVHGQEILDRRTDATALRRRRRARRAMKVGLLTTAMGALGGLVVAAATLKGPEELLAAEVARVSTTTNNVELQVDRVLRELWKMEVQEGR